MKRQLGFLQRGFRFLFSSVFVAQVIIYNSPKILNKGCSRGQNPRSILSMALLSLMKGEPTQTKMEALLGGQAPLGRLIWNIGLYPWALGVPVKSHLVLFRALWGIKCNVGAVLKTRPRGRTFGVWPSPPRKPSLRALCSDLFPTRTVGTPFLRDRFRVQGLVLVAAFIKSCCPQRFLMICIEVRQQPPRK